MKKILPLILLFACSGKGKVDAPTSPTVVDEKADWVIYEGIIKTEFGEGPVELSLLQNEFGLESQFRLMGRMTDDQDFGFLNGSYSILSGSPNQEIIIKAHGGMYIFSESDRKKMIENTDRYKKNLKPLFVKPKILEFDLFFKSDGNNKLVLTDEDFEPIADDSRYTLYKRARLFTAEGYITIEKNRTDFIETNTAETWNVASIGLYNEAQKAYDSIATEKFEGVYLKAVAYTIPSDTSDEDLLVIKRILEIKKSDAYTDKEKAARLTH